MYSDIIVTVNLKGQLSGPVSHTEKQKHSVLIPSSENSTKSTYLTRQIIHSDRKEVSCIRRERISDSVVNSWVKGECPDWIKPRDWVKMNSRARFLSYLNRFDEGFGVSYEEI